MSTAPANVPPCHPLQCDVRGCSAHACKCYNGVIWDSNCERSNIVGGNALCRHHMEMVQAKVGMYRPAPGRSKPSRFLVARQKNKHIVGEAAITFAIAQGNWLKAAEIGKVSKRFTPLQLRCVPRPPWAPELLKCSVGDESLPMLIPLEDISTISTQSPTQPPTQTPTQKTKTSYLSMCPYYRRNSIVCGKCQRVMGGKKGPNGSYVIRKHYTLEGFPCFG